MVKKNHVQKSDSKQLKKMSSQSNVDTGTVHRQDDFTSLLQRTQSNQDGISPADIIQLQRYLGNQETQNVLQDGLTSFRLPSAFITPTKKSPIQRVYDDPEFLATPYPTTHTPPDFEYWVNSMWKEVKDKSIKETVITLLNNGSDSPKSAGDLSKNIKTQVLNQLYAQAYQQKDWVSATQLLLDKALTHRIEAPGDNGDTQTIAAGFHGTWRDPQTVIEQHKGTVPTIERHGKDKNDKAGIQDYLKTKLGIEEWHPFWFDGDISQRPFIFRNNQEDNELDTTISVANSAFDALDFPMVNSDFMIATPEADREYNEDGLRVITNYVYLVGVTSGFNTRAMQGENAFGSGEIATQQLLPDDHLGWVQYKRVHAGGGRDDGHTFERLGQGILPGAFSRGVDDQVMAILGTMPTSGARYNPKDVNTIYSELKTMGENKGKSKAHANKTVADWKKYSLIANHKYMESAPSPKAKRKRLRAFLEGVDIAQGKNLHTQIPDDYYKDETG